MGEMKMSGPVYYHKSLRNPNINYRSGWWSVTVQVAKNKSILGAIVGEKVVLNELGRAVVASQGFFAGELRPRRVWAKCAASAARQKSTARRQPATAMKPLNLS